MKLHLLTVVTILMFISAVALHLASPYLAKKYCNPVIILHKTQVTDKFFYELDMNGELRYLWSPKDQPVGSVVCYPYR